MGRLRGSGSSTVAQGPTLRRVWHVVGNAAPVFKFLMIFAMRLCLVSEVHVITELVLPSCT